jgi:tetratricopeptide (TPR) repeat protein
MAVSMRHRWLNRLLAGTLCVVAVCVVQQASVLMVADWTSSLARQDLVKWSAGQAPYTPEQWEKTRLALENALASTPRDATLHDALAQLHALQGRTLWTSGAPDSPEVAAYNQALRHQAASIDVRPAHGMAWANLALFHYAVNSTQEDLLKAWREAARLAPHEDQVEATLVYVATQVWPVAPNDLRQWVEARRPGLSAQLDSGTATPK